MRNKILGFIQRAWTRHLLSQSQHIWKWEHVLRHYGVLDSWEPQTSISQMRNYITKVICKLKLPQAAELRITQKLQGRTYPARSGSNLTLYITIYGNSWLLTPAVNQCSVFVRPAYSAFGEELFAAEPWGVSLPRDCKTWSFLTSVSKMRLAVFPSREQLTNSTVTVCTSLSCPFFTL